MIAMIFMTGTKYVCNLGPKGAKYACNVDNKGEYACNHCPKGAKYACNLDNKGEYGCNLSFEGVQICLQFKRDHYKGPFWTIFDIAIIFGPN